MIIKGYQKTKQYIKSNWFPLTMWSLKMYSSIRIWALISKHCMAAIVEDTKTYNVQFLVVRKTNLWGEGGRDQYCSWSDADCCIFYSSILYLHKNPKSGSSLRAGPLITSASLALGLWPLSEELGLKQCCSGRLWLHVTKRPTPAKFLPPFSFMQGPFVYFKPFPCWMY